LLARTEKAQVESKPVQDFSILPLFVLMQNWAALVGSFCTEVSG